MKPLAFLTLQSAFVVWRQLNALFLVLSIYLALVHLRAMPLAPVFVMALAAGLASFPFQETMLLGQVGGLVLLLWTMGARCAGDKRPILGAFCFALGAMTKVTPGLVVPLFILRKQWKWLFAYVGWTALFLVVGVWQVGWDNHVSYFSRILPAMSCGFPNSRNKSLVTVIQSLYFGDAFYESDGVTLIPPGLCLFGKAVSLALFCGVLVYFYKRSKEATGLGYEVTVLAVVSLLVSPLTWRHHYVLILLPLLYLWIGAKRLSSYRLAWPLLLTATVAVTTVFPLYLLEVVHHPALQIAVSAIVPVGALVLLVLSLVDYSPLTNKVDAEAGGQSQTWRTVSLTPAAELNDARATTENVGAAVGLSRL